jgi:hypothetical protein
MSLASKQRDAIIRERGEPLLRMEFDVFEGGAVSMWTHFQHGDDFHGVRALLMAVEAHLGEFIRDGRMCPFHPADRRGGAAGGPSPDPGGTERNDDERS